MSPNSEDHLVNILRQPPIAPSRQISRDSDLSVSEDVAKKELTPPLAASVITPRENTQGYSVISSSNDTLSSLSTSSTKMPLLDDTIVRQQASTTIVANEPSPNKRKSPDSSPPSRRDSLPLGLRNKKMKATDCLLFAATLLEQETSQPMVSPPIPAVPTTTIKPKKTKKPLKKMFCEKVERSMQEAKKKKQELEQQQQEQLQEEEEPEDYDNENKPKDADVLCGRGGKVNKHPGNIVYRKVVEYNKSYYQSVHKKHRILVSQSIVRAILNYGGRFMGQKGKEWTPICFKRAVQKTSQALRERSNTSDAGSPITVPPSGSSPFPDTLHFKPQQLISKD